MRGGWGCSHPLLPFLAVIIQTVDRAVEHNVVFDVCRRVARSGREDGLRRRHRGVVAQRAALLLPVPPWSVRRRPQRKRLGKSAVLERRCRPVAVPGQRAEVDAA